MSHDEARAQVAALFGGNEDVVQRAPLREHLEGCEPCRMHYDAVAMAMRRMLGRPEEMAPEELFLFQPPLPAAAAPAKVIPLFRPMPVVALALAATLAAVVVWYGSAKTVDDFGVRGSPHETAVQPGARAICMRGEEPAATCAEGDTVLFAVTPNGLTHVKVLDGQTVVGEGDVADVADAPLKWTVPWRPGLSVQAVFSKCATCAPKAVTVAP